MTTIDLKKIKEFATRHHVTIDIQIDPWHSSFGLIMKKGACRIGEYITLDELESAKAVDLIFYRLDKMLKNLNRVIEKER